MMWKSHLGSGTALLATGAIWGGVLADPLGPQAHLADQIASLVLMPLAKSVHFVFDVGYPYWAGHSVSITAGAVMQWVAPWLMRSGMSLWIPLVISTAVFWLGCLLPDMDSPTSKVGRLLPLRLPGPHRGLTHTIWPVIALLMLANLPGLRVLAFLALGWLTHLMMDALSSAGLTLTYPLNRSRWKVVTLSDGRRCVVRRRWRGIYTVGRSSEHLVLGAVCLIPLASALAVLLLE